LVIGLCSQPAAARERSKDSRPRTLADVNAALEGLVATVEFGEGHLVRRARNVYVEPEFTYWHERGREEQILTSEVRRISVRPKRRFLKKIGIGLAAGTAVGLFGSGGGDTMVEAAGAAQTVGVSMAAGGLLGAIAAANVGGRGRRVVYEGPVDRYLEAQRFPVEP
jgi:hypothetical protein